MWLPTNDRSTSPNIRLVSNDIAPYDYMTQQCHWSVSTSLTSDHVTILITINSELSTIDGPWRTYINVKKADWARYAEACVKVFAEAGETRAVEQAEKTFWKAVNKASGLLITVDRIRHFQPILPASAKSLVEGAD